MSDVDVSKTVDPKSDQLNTDDLIAGPRTIKISNVTASNTPEQPVSVHYEGDNGKPWKPCKSMRRVLLALWGSKGSGYVGKRVTLYRDDTVKFGGIEVGGIRISHADIDADVTIALTESRAKRKPTVIRKLAAALSVTAAIKGPMVALSSALMSAGYDTPTARLGWVSDRLNKRITASKDIPADKMPELIAAAEAEALIANPEPGSDG